MCLSLPFCKARDPFFRVSFDDNLVSLTSTTLAEWNVIFSVHCPEYVIGELLNCIDG